MCLFCLPPCDLTHSASIPLAITESNSTTHSFCPYIQETVHLYIWHILFSDSWCYCSSVSHHFIQFHAAELDIASIIKFYLSSIHASTVRHCLCGENSCLMDRNRGRQCAALTYWKCKTSYYSFLELVPQSHFSCPCQLLSQRGCNNIHTVLLSFHFTIMLITCTCTTVAALDKKIK